MPTNTEFEQRVEEVDRRLRELAPAAAPEIGCERRNGAATWRYGDAWGTLSINETETPPALKLLLYKRPASDEQNAVEVAIDDEDVVDVLAEPLAGLFDGRVT